MSANPDNIEERLVVVADAFAALISARPYIAPLQAVTERKGDINAMIAAALQKLGLSIAIVAADGDGLTTKGDTIALRVRLVAQITELYLVNQGGSGSKKPALAVAVAVMKAVHRKPNGLDVGHHIAGLNEFELAEDRPFRLVPDPRSIVYQVTAYTTVDL